MYVKECTTAFVSSKSFIVSGFTSKSLIHFEFYFSVWSQEVFQFHSFTCSYPVFPAPLNEETIFLHCIFLPPFSKLCGFISGLSVLFHWSIFLFLCQQHTVLMTIASDDMILCIEHPKYATRKLLDLINEYSKVEEYKIYTQKSLAFLYTNNKKQKEKLR